MPRQAANKVEKKFIRGLITDVTALNFPEDASTDTDNCVFDFTGRVTRRLGIDLEEDYAISDGGPIFDDTFCFTEYLWEAAAGSEKTFAVYQFGGAIGFFDVSNSTVLDTLHTTIDLDDYLPAGSGLDETTFNCQYASGRGNLIIVNPAINPIYVQYDPLTDEIDVTSFEIQTRDFKGLDDGLTLTNRPTETATSLGTNNPEHYYNLLNQGWTTTDSLAQWDAARADMPSNADYVALYRASVTDSFDNARVLSLSPLSRPAPKGHFILTVTNPNHDDAMAADGFTAASISGENVRIGQGIGSILSSGMSTLTTVSTVFDGQTNVGDIKAGPLPFFGAAFDNPTSFIGKNYSSAPIIITRALIYGTNNSGYITGANPSITFTLRASQTAPTTATDGTSLGTLTFLDTADEHIGREITSSDLTTSWNYVWVHQDLGSSSVVIVELELFTLGSSLNIISTNRRPSCVAFYAARAFYAGLEAFALNNTIFFTQILEKEEQYGKCYSVNDPTGEYFFDLLSSDGGTIEIPEMGRVTRLVNCKNALIVIATNGVWAISGSAGNYFRANDYQVKRISTIGSTSPLSVVDAQGLPVWWGQEGIYSLKFDPSYDAFSLEFLSVGIIDIFLSELPTENKKYVKGVYSPEDYMIFWLFNDGVLGDNKYTYNRVLCYDIRTKAYYPWTLTSGVGSLIIRGNLFVQAADRTGTPAVKYTVTYDNTIVTSAITFATISDPIHRDWFTYDDEIEDIDGAQEYDSYFITGYYIPGDAVRFSQVNYILTLLEQNDADESCYVQGAFEYAITGDSGKWGSRQEIYTGFMEDRSLTWRRLKLRGKGRSIQLRYSSNGTKPFTIIGWSLFMSTNQGL